MNKIILTGNLGHAATVREVPKRDGQGSTPVCNFDLAVRLGYGASERTQWWDCAWWGERAAKCAQWLEKGSRVLIVAEVDVRQFTKRDGTAGVALTAHVHELEFIGGRREGEPSPGGKAEAAPATMVPGAKEAAAKAPEDVPY